MLEKDVVRFWAKVKKNKSCWIWIGGSTNYGYGLFHMSRSCRQNRMRRSHRVSWEICNGVIPDKLCVLHKCDNRLCVNPNHLFLGTRKDNNLDMIFKGRAPWGKNDRHLTHCHRGHLRSKFEKRTFKRVSVKGVKYFGKTCRLCFNEIERSKAHERKKQGICVNCNKRVVTKTLCEIHRKKLKEATSDYYWIRKSKQNSHH